MATEKNLHENKQIDSLVNYIVKGHESDDVDYVEVFNNWNTSEADKVDDLDTALRCLRIIKKEQDVISAYNKRGCNC